MFIGHFAIGLASKRAAPKASLGLLLAAPLLADLLWPLFLLLGWEHVGINPQGPAFLKLDFLWYPWSHSLVMDCLWAALFAGIYYAVTRYRSGAVVIRKFITCVLYAFESPQTDCALRTWPPRPSRPMVSQIALLEPMRCAPG